MMLPVDSDTWTVAWTTDESRLYLGCGQRGRFLVAVAADNGLALAKLTDTKEVHLLPCYGRVGPSRWSGGGKWGQSYNRDDCGERRVWSVPGLGSSVRVYRENEESRDAFVIAVNPGLLHLSAVRFGDVAFLKDCEELLLEATGGIYLADLKLRRLGMVAKGENFVLMSARFQKRLD
jgi:hypothetical protein